MKRIFLIVGLLLLSAFPVMATNISWTDKVADDGIEPVDATEALTHEDANAIKTAVNSKQDSSANLTEWTNTNPSENGKSLVAAADYSGMRTLLDVPVTAATLVGSCTVGPCLDGTSDGGDLIKLYGPSGFWTAIQAGNAAANRSWRLPLIAPPGTGEVHTMTMDENGQMAFWNLLAVINAGVPNGTGTKVDWSQLANVPAGFADGTDDGSGGSADDTAYNDTSWDANTDAPTKNVIRDYLHNFDADGDGDYTDETWFPSTSGAPTNATYFTATAEAGLSAEANLGALTTGLLKISVAGGTATPSTASPGTDYVTPSGNITGTAGGLSGTPNITVGTISAGATGFSVDADGDVTAKSYLTSAADGSRYTILPNNTSIAPLGDGSEEIYNEGGQIKVVEADTEYDMLHSGDVDDTPDNGDTTTPPSANWAYDHAAATATHGVSGAIVGTTDSATLTNKTLDVEGTGNSITIVDKVWFAAGGCNNTTATSFYDLPTSNPAAAACITGTNTQKGVLDFDAATDESGQVSLALPSDWSGNIDLKYKWLAAATSGSVVWGVQTSCVADAETDNPSWNTASTATDAAKGTTLQTNDASMTTITVTGCAAGELMHLRFFRDADNGSDDMTGDARLIGAELTLRRAQ